jgi:VIT1/CCC1 family predicted Fe2+/Mn2+ transporter
MGDVVLLLAFLLVLLFFGGFTVHLPWAFAVFLLVLWLLGFAIGRGEGAGRHRFYGW